MHTLSIRLDDSIYEHFKEFLRFYPKNKLAIVDDEEDIIFTQSNAKAYDEALHDMENGSTINWKDYAKTRNLDV
jgi:hypothetical protein